MVVPFTAALHKSYAPTNTMRAIPFSRSLEFGEQLPRRHRMSYADVEV